MKHSCSCLFSKGEQDRASLESSLYDEELNMSLISSQLVFHIEDDYVKL